MVVLARALPVAAVLLAGCGGGAQSPRASPALEKAGAVVVAQSGCEACHRIGDQGNDGPGPALTTVGARLSRASLVHALDDPREPMPSFAALPPSQHKAVIAYLVSLRSARSVIP